MSGPSTNPYVPPTLTGYNANPPANDGSQTPQNEINWDTHLGNIGNPLVAFSGNIDSNVLAAFGKTLNTDAGVNTAIGGSVGFDLQSTTIINDAVTLNKANVQLDTEGAAATDDLVTITGTNSTEGTFYSLKSTNALRVITVKHGTGNIFLANGEDATLDVNFPLEVEKQGSNFYEKSRSIQPQPETFPVGTVDFQISSTPPSGWLMLNGDTLGSAASGATQADDLYQTLYELFWNEMADAQAPVTGGRGASANADWTANKTLTMPDARSRSLVGTGQGSGLTNRVNGETGGEEAHDQTISEMASHQHKLLIPNSSYGVAPAANTVRATGTTTTTNTLAKDGHMENNGGTTAFNVMHPYLALHARVKF